VSDTVVVTDSTSSLPQDVLKEWGVSVVSLYVHFPDGTRRREDELDVERFYRDLVQTEDTPTTSAPDVEDFVGAYGPLLDEGHRIVSVHISSGMSETCNNARQAAARLDAGDRVQVVDGASTGAGLGLLVLAAAAGARAGDDPAVIVERVRGARQTMKNWLVLDTLEFLRRGGRIGGAAAWLGSRLQVKPILTVEAEIRAVERVRTRERAFERLVDFAHRLHAAGADAWSVAHGDNEAAAAELVNRGQKIFRRPPLSVSEFTPVLGTHTGPGLLMLAGMDPAWLDPEPRPA
jgi:DegV family protein with EDD domain